MSRRDGNADEFYAAIEREIDECEGPGAGKIAVLMIKSITSHWRGDCRTWLTDEQRAVSIHEARSDYTIYVHLICDSDSELHVHLGKLAQKGGVVTETDRRNFTIYFSSATTHPPSLLNQLVSSAVREFYERHNLP